jgi:hypothetical protein
MTPYSPSRAYVLGVYLKRILRWRRNSWPYLSVDAFSILADVVVYPPKYRQRAPTRKQIEAAEVIFCPSDRLEEFLKEYGNAINPKVIISGNSDYEFWEIPKNLPKSLKLLLLQNSFVSNNETIMTIPIGVENFRFGVNGNPKLFQFSEIPNRARGRILFGPFGETHPIRKSVTSTFMGVSEKWIFLKERISPQRYSQLVAEDFEFVACVRGNGVDTHRLWETIYRGRKAIVRQDAWLDSLNFLKPFIHVIGEWGIEELSKCEKTTTPDFNPKEVEELWMPYWSKLIRELCD